MQTTKKNTAKQKYFHKQNFLYPEISDSRAQKGYVNVLYIMYSVTLSIS